MPTNFLTLKEILAELKGKNSITALRKYYQDEWEFYDLLRGLMNDEDFKQARIDKSFNESCKKDLDHYIELANQAKKAVSKYFERKDIELQAYYTGANDADRVLKINLTNHDENGPIRISDILQQEKNISELNVYCNKKHDICAYRENKKRHYEFKESAYYEMTSTWPIKDESGKVVSTCIMVMNVSSDGITEILKFDGRDFESPSKEFWELIGVNEELYIQGLSLYDVVKALLEKNKAAPLPDIVPTANNSMQNNAPIRVDQDKELNRQSLENNAGNNPISPTNSDASTQTEVNLQRVATQVEIHSQPIATQQEIKELNKQRNDLQRELEKERQKNTKLQVELKQKNKELANTSANLQEKTQELESVYKEKEDLKKRLEVANIEKKELLNKLRELQEKLYQLEKKNYRLEDENDQLERSNKRLEKEKEQLLQKILGLEEVSLSLEEERQALSDSVEKQIKLKQKLIKAIQEIEKLGKENNSLQAEHEEKEIGKIRERIIQINKEKKEKEEKEEKEQKVQELCKENKKLKEKLKLVDVQNMKLKDELGKSKRAKQQTYEDTELVISENLKNTQDLYTQLQKLKQEKQEAEERYICAIEKLVYEIEKLENELENEREMRKKYHTLLKERDIEINDLKEIIKDKVQDIENLKGELQNKKEGEVFRNQAEALEKDIRLLASKQISFNQAYTITVGVLNDPDNVPLKKRKLSRSLSTNSEYNSDKESYNNHCHSPLSFVSNPIQVNSACTGQSERSNHSSIYPQNSLP
ncbi:coiled-coil domain-containing protein [Wolbachia endosymbiont of Tettigetta isshikii]|uniref:hypothetical protein n=1 Tax=Wolbachia endosymbiont of Tettigetta isshikii TaxID=3239093 RepID=UPI0039806A97